MNSPETSPNTHEKQSPRAADGASKINTGAHELAGAASSGATDKARQLREQVETAASAAQSKTSSLAHDAALTAKRVTERAENTARSVGTAGKDMLNDVKQEAGALLHDAQDYAVESYDSAREQALGVAHEASELARHASERTVRYVRRASASTGRFATTHALPLAALGASLGWLAWSVRSEGRRAERELSLRSPRMRTTRDEASAERRLSRVAPTTSGNRLMGVRIPDARDEY